jgi:phosphate:Na+ symporter
MGGVALLLWGMHMVQSGVLRAAGADLRRLIAAGLRSRWHAFAAGLGVTALLQSSTATLLMATSFAASGIVDLTPALAVMLGANVGTTLIVQLLSFDIGWLSPLLLVLGVASFKRGGRTRMRDLGRVMIGLGLMILALHLLRLVLEQAEAAPALQTLFAAVSDAPVIDLLIAAVLAWAAHSSVAVVLLAMSLASGHVVPPVAALALVLGANIGSAVNPLLEGAGAADPANRRLPVGNLVTRLVGCALALPFLGPLAGALARLEPDAARQAADFHTLFNLGLALLFILPLDGFARMLRRLLPAAAASVDPAAPAYLDRAAVNAPSVALTCAARETLHMGDIVEAMLRQSMTALLTDDRKLVGEIERMDDAVDRLHEAIKLYVTEVTREALDAEDGRRAMAIIAFAINLEHIGDIVEMNLMELAAKKIRSKLKFSREGASELEAFHRRVVDNLKLALGVFISGDAKIARRLLEEKVAVREAERVAADNHFARLRQGRAESIETSSLHLDILRDLKRIHSHICSVAYPVLEAAGELQPSRLKATRAALPVHDVPDEVPPSPAR